MPVNAVFLDNPSREQFDAGLHSVHPNAPVGDLVDRAWIACRLWRDGQVSCLIGSELDINIRWQWRNGQHKVIIETRLTF